MLFIKIYLLIGLVYTIYRLIHVYSIQEVFFTIIHAILAMLFWIVDVLVYFLKKVSKLRFKKYTGKEFISRGDLIKLNFKKYNNIHVYTRLCFINKNKLKELRK